MSQPISIRFSGTERAEIDRRAKNAGLTASAYVRATALGQLAPDTAREQIRVLTDKLRRLTDAIDDAVADQQDVVSEIETAAGLVREDGSRVDEPVRPARKVR